MGYYRKIINGIILIIIGISSIGILSWLYDQATIGLSYCNTFGDIGYLLFEDCDNVSIVSSATLIDLLIGSLMILAGIILLIVGIVKCKKPKVIKSNQLKQVINPVFDKLTKSNESQDNNIYCRYCGNTRPLEGILCPRCGKASRYEQLVECNSCHSLINDYSRYCSNCGMEMEQEHHVDSQLTYKTYESPIDMLKIKYPSHWIIIDENLSYQHVLKICTPPDSLSFFMTINIKKPNTEERELTKENLKIIFKEMIDEPFKINSSPTNIIEAQISSFKGYNAHQLVTKSYNNKIKIYFSILMGYKFSEKSTSILNKDKIKILRITCLYAKENNSTFLPIYNEMIESLEFKTIPKNDNRFK
jgi:hypothetical protein